MGSNLFLRIYLNAYLGYYQKVDLESLKLELTTYHLLSIYYLKMLRYEESNVIADK